MLTSLRLNPHPQGETKKLKGLNLKSFQAENFRLESCCFIYVVLGKEQFQMTLQRMEVSPLLLKLLL